MLDLFPPRERLSEGPATPVSTLWGAMKLAPPWKRDAMGKLSLSFFLPPTSNAYDDVSGEQVVLVLTTGGSFSASPGQGECTDTSPGWNNDYEHSSPYMRGARQRDSSRRATVADGEQKPCASPRAPSHGPP